LTGGVRIERVVNQDGESKRVAFGPVRNLFALLVHTELNVVLGDVGWCRILFPDGCDGDCCTPARSRFGHRRRKCNGRREKSKAQEQSRLAQLQVHVPSLPFLYFHMIRCGGAGFSGYVIYHALLCLSLSARTGKTLETEKRCAGESGARKI